MKKKYILIGSFIVLITMISYIMNLKTTFANFTEKKPVPEFDDPGQRVLIIVPHPDDESLGTAGIISRAVKLNRPIKVVIVTDGESYKKAAVLFSGHNNPTSNDFYRLGLQRQKESISAMAALGLQRKNLIFLGFADGSTRFLWSEFWDNNEPRMSGGTHVAYSPYKNIYRPKIGYTGHDLENCIKSIIKNFKPTDIYYPLPDDIHPDHWAVSNFVRYAIVSMNLNVRQHMFLIHHPQWPVPWLLEPNKPQLPPVDMNDSNTDWQIFNLDNQEISKKLIAIKKYKTQIDAMGPFMLGFVRKNELFAVKPVIKIPTVNSMPNLEAIYMPYTLLQIPTGGILSQEIYRSADLTKFSSFLYNNLLYIGVQSVAPLSSNVTYHIEMRLFYNNKIKRIDLGLIKGKMVQFRRSSNSLQNVLLSQPLIYRNRLWIKLNVPDKQNLRYIFIGADSIYMGRLIDKIPWNMYKIQ